MIRLVPSWLIVGSVLTTLSIGTARAQSLPPAPVPIGADGTGSSGTQFQSPPPLPATGIYDNQQPPPRVDVYRPSAPPPGLGPTTGLGPPPGIPAPGQPPVFRPDLSDMSAPTYPPPPYPLGVLPPPVVTAEQAVERERIYFLSWHERPGWYFDLEASIVGPHVMNRLYQKVNLSDGWKDYLHLPSADLGGTVSPRFEVGYRFGENLGALLISYRFLTSQGVINYYDGSNGMPTGQLNSRLDLQTLDLDYATRDFQLGRSWELRGRLGARVGYAYFDSHDQEVYFPYDPTDPLLFNSVKTSNRFAGAGPHAMLELEHRFRSPALSAFTRVEGSLLIGQVEQEFEESLAQGSAYAYGSASPRSTQAVPVLQTQFGFRWRPTWHDNWNFAAGYTYEQWWSVGNAGGSTAQIWSQGCFLRGEVMF